MTLHYYAGGVFISGGGLFYNYNVIVLVSCAGVSAVESIFFDKAAYPVRIKRAVGDCGDLLENSENLNVKRVYVER